MNPVSRWGHNHWLHCGAWNGPAERPTWCQCGGFQNTPSLIEKAWLWAHQNWRYWRGTM